MDDLLFLVLFTNGGNKVELQNKPMYLCYLTLQTWLHIFHFKDEEDDDDIATF